MGSRTHLLKGHSVAVTVSCGNCYYTKGGFLWVDCGTALLERGSEAPAGPKIGN